jgi:hypothetical protein
MVGLDSNSDSPYRSFLATRDQILRHKAIESEKVGYDIGFEAALFDWVTNYQSILLTNEKEQNLSS